MKRRPFAARWFWLLMAAAAFSSVLSPRYTQWMRSLVVPLTWVTALLSGGTAAAHEIAVAPRDLEGVTPEQLAELQRRNDEMQLQVQHQSLRLAEAERLIEDLTLLRDQLRGQDVRIRLATRIAGGDASPGRANITISAGSLHDVREGDWILAGRPSAETDAALTGWDLMMRQVVIGRVAVVERFRSTVRLVSDPAFGPEKVWVAQKLADGTLQVVDQDALIYGQGDGKMLIKEATQDHFTNGSLQVLIPIGTRFASPLILGQITGRRPVRESALHFDLEVTPAGDARWLTHVYVVMLDR